MTHSAKPRAETIPADDDTETTMTTLYSGRTADGFWRAEVRAIPWAGSTRYCVERYERVFPKGDNAKWVDRPGAEGFPHFATAEQANTEARIWLERHENLSQAATEKQK